MINSLDSLSVASSTPSLFATLLTQQTKEVASLQALANQGLEVSDIWEDLWNCSGEPAPSALAKFATAMRLFREDCKLQLGCAV